MNELGKGHADHRLLDRAGHRGRDWQAPARRQRQRRCLPLLLGSAGTEREDLSKLSQGPREKVSWNLLSGPA